MHGQKSFSAFASSTGSFAIATNNYKLVTSRDFEGKYFRFLQSFILVLPSGAAVLFLEVVQVESTKIRIKANQVLLLGVYFYFSYINRICVTRWYQRWCLRTRSLSHLWKRCSSKPPFPCARTVSVCLPLDRWRRWRQTRTLGQLSLRLKQMPSKTTFSFNSRSKPIIWLVWPSWTQQRLSLSSVSPKILYSSQRRILLFSENIFESAWLKSLCLILQPFPPTTINLLSWVRARRWQVLSNPTRFFTTFVGW